MHRLLIKLPAFWCYGFHNVTSSYGTNGFTKDHLEAFKRYGTQRVLVAYDRDEAGDHAAEILSQKLTAEGIDCYRVRFPMDQDANQYAQQAQSPGKALNHVIQNAVCMGSGSKTINVNANVDTNKTAKEEKEKQEALVLLKAPDLLERILRDFEKCGVVGEQTNKLVSYLAAVSRKLESPLAILIQSSSAAGKTWLMESVLAFVPEEERIKYSAMTGQSLFYMGETNIKHKILAIVEEEGAERTRYALKLLQSEGELSIASTGKDPVTGVLTTKEYRVEGPVMIFSTTTDIDIDEELQNRCIIRHYHGRRKP